jgi:stalled ribosome alternative rescue factor ArfA
MKKSIGTRCESSLHRALKFTYAGRRTEKEVAGYVADGISAEGEFIEVQIGSFAPLRQKAPKLAQLGGLRIIYPVFIVKYIEVFDLKGKRAYRRKSPRRGTPWDLFDALVHAPELPLTRGLTIELVLLDVSEQRIRDGKGSWRRKGVSIKDHTLLAVHERICLEKPADYFRFIPFTRKECFTSASLAEKAGIRRELAQKTLYVLAKLGIIEKTGKERNALVYQIAAK